MNGDLRHSKGLGDLLQGRRGIALLEKALEKLHDFHLAIGVVHAQPPDLSSTVLIFFGFRLFWFTTFRCP